MSSTTRRSPPYSARARSCRGRSASRWSKACWKSSGRLGAAPRRGQSSPGRTAGSRRADRRPAIRPNRVSRSSTSVSGWPAVMAANASRWLASTVALRRSTTACSTCVPGRGGQPIGFSLMSGVTGPFTFSPKLDGAQERRGLGREERQDLPAARRYSGGADGSAGSAHRPPRRR